MPLSTLAKSLIPTVSTSEWKKLAAEAELAERALKKDKTDAKAKKTLKSYADAIDKLEGQFGKVVDALDEKCGEIIDALDAMAKLTPMPDVIGKVLDRQRKILASSRAPELKDLRKEQKRAALRSNPGKLERLIGDLNDDVAAVNTLDEQADKATDAMFFEEIEVMRKEIVAQLEAPITATSLMLNAHIKTFSAAQQKKRWKGFDAARKTFVANRLADAAESLRKQQISDLTRDKAFAALESKSRFKITEAAQRNGDTVSQARAHLQVALAAQLQAAAAALEAQWTLKQKVWAKHLGMEGYGIVQRGSHDGYKIHITYDNNSWTAAAYKGVSVHLGGGSADKIFDALFDVDWAYQFHATLELPDKDGKHPHLYAFGEDNPKRWIAAQSHNEKDKEWTKTAKKAVQGVLDAYIKDVKKKIQKVIDDAPKK
jgi:hypothetical protein